MTIVFFIIWEDTQTHLRPNREPPTGLQWNNDNDSRNDIDVSNIKHQNRQRDSPYPLAVAVAVAAAAAAVTVAVAVSDMAGEKRISAGSVVPCFDVAS